jgi:hypothetical protein
MKRLWWALPIAALVIATALLVLNVQTGAPPQALAPAPPPAAIPAAPPVASPTTQAPTKSPTPSSPASPVTPVPNSGLDAVLKKLLRGNIAFNNPEQMRVGETGQIEAVLSINMPADELMNQLSAAGRRESASILVSDHMEATLSGGGAFDVAPAGPQTQWISKDEATTWHWLVTPKLTGPQYLTLSVDAIITINGDKDTRNITTLTRQIEVEIARPHNEEEWFGQIKTWIEAVGWGWGVLAALIAAGASFWHKIQSWIRPKRKRVEVVKADENHD